WNSTASVGSNAAINAGTLDIAFESAAWETSIANIVPGDTLTHVANFEITALGDNLEAEVVVPASSIVVADASQASTNLKAIFDAKTWIELKDDGTFVDLATYTFEEGSYDLTVTTTIVWEDGATATDNGAKLGKVSL